MGESNLKYNRIGPTSSRSEKLSNWTNQVDQIEFFAFVVSTAFHGNSVKLLPAGFCVRSILGTPPCITRLVTPVAQSNPVILLHYERLLPLLSRTILVKQLRLQILPGWNALMKPTCDVVAACHGRVMLTTEKVSPILCLIALSPKL